MKKFYVFLLLLAVAFSDIVLLNVSHFLAYHLTNKYLIDVDQAVYLKNIWSCNISWLISAAICRVYTPQSIHKLDKIYTSTIASATVHLVLFSAYLLFTQSAFPVEFLASIVPLIGMSFLLSRFTARALRELLPDSVVETVIAKRIERAETVTA